MRLKGIHNPIIDHPGWRQGDESAIARNFATLDYNPLHPQTDYNGPPPNYVELELQIVPFLAATLYKLFGIHEIFGRLISVAFSLGTIAVLALFARWLFFDALAGLFAALLFAIMPGHLSMLSWSHAIVLGLLLGFAAVIGDLAESIIKRSAGVKDSGNFLPGIGGALDLIDSLLFTAPLLFFYLRLVIRVP